MMTWPVHPAADLFPLLEGDEADALRDDIQIHGLLEPVWLYEVDGVVTLLDGRNRLAACEDLGIEPETRFYRGDDPIEFVWSQNFHRRHLTKGQTAFTLLKREELEAAEAEERMLAGKADPNAERHEGSPFDRQAVSRAAKGSGVSGRTVARAKRIEEKAPDLAEQVKAGTLAIDRADRIVRDREAEQRRVDEARKQAEAAPIVATVDIRLGDFREVLADIPDGSVDAIITDPPYPKEFIPLLADLGQWADRVLTEDGVLAVLMGQTHLPEVYRLLEGGRPYRWTMAYMTEGPGYVSHPRKVQSNWKPVILYGGGPRTADVVRSIGSDAGAKDLHKWGQDFSAFSTLVERLTKPGETVADPFMGAGTTLLAAKALGRYSIGADIETESFETAQKRLAH